MPEIHQDQAVLETIVRSICDAPEEIQIKRTVDERGVLLTLKVQPADMGKVVGTKGAMAGAMRTILAFIGVKNNSHVSLKIENPPGWSRPPRREGWDRGED